MYFPQIMFRLNEMQLILAIMEVERKSKCPDA